jgi:hypothetical protein
VDGLDRSANFWQAMAMISMESACTMIEAESKLRDRAAIDGRLVEETAADVVERRVRVIK